MRSLKFKNFYNKNVWNFYRIFLTFLIALFFVNCDFQEKSGGESLKVENNPIDKSPNTFQFATIEWNPYVGEKLPNYGYSAELVKMAFAEENIDAKIVFYPYIRIINLAKEGKLEGYFPEYENEENKESFLYSDPFPGGEIGILARKESHLNLGISKNMSDFTHWKPYKIGVVRGYVNTAAFDNANYLQKEEAPDDLSNIKKLLFKRVDFIIIDPNVGAFLINENKALVESRNQELEFLEPGLDYKELFLCFSRKSPHAKNLNEKFNSGLAKLRKSGKLALLLKEHHFESGKYNP